jgi:hypothetical protein
MYAKCVIDLLEVLDKIRIVMCDIYVLFGGGESELC